MYDIEEITITDDPKYMTSEDFAVLESVASRIGLQVETVGDDYAYYINSLNS